MSALLSGFRGKRLAHGFRFCQALLLTALVIAVLICEFAVWP